ncbi:MAG: hypothetical protein JSR81_00605 [Proteobacteria bacterium]|nr:hypothetical protein [Pseudomonadota bacterium]
MTVSTRRAILPSPHAAASIAPSAGDGMMADKSFGWRVYGLGIIALALMCLIWGDFHGGQPVPKTFPARTALAYAVAIFMLVAGIALEWRKTALWAAAALAAYYGIIVVLVMNGRLVLRNLEIYGAYDSMAEQLAITAGAFILWASLAKLDAATSARFIRIGQIAFGICAIFFGGAHFVYMNLTAPLIPTWLPPNQLFWGYATGVFHIAGGLAIVMTIRARLAAILLAVMYAIFTVFALVPGLVVRSSFFAWTEIATSVILVGVAWIVADSLAARRAA